MNATAAPSTLRPEPSHPSSSVGSRRSLDCFFAPTTVAVIGATARQGSVGCAVLENLAEFRGRVFAVNPRHTEVLGFPCFGRIGEVPGPVDLAVVVTPARTVPDVVRECGAAGVKGVVIISAGFKETGAAGLRLEEETLRSAREAGVRVIGPNCLGVMAPHQRLNATFAQTMARPGRVAFLSQSGALCTAVLDWSLRENVGFSAFVSVGSMLDVNWADLIDYLGDDPNTGSIVMYVESIGEARAFISAARAVAFHKPITLVKVGRTAAAAQAAASHTGSLTGHDAVLDALFRRAGVLRVDTIEELFDMAETLGKQPRPKGPRLAIVTNAGGPGALAVDRLVAGGGEVARLSAETVAALNRLLPAHWSHGNPVDVLGDADERRYARAVELVARDPGADGVLVILAPQAMTDALATAEKIKSLGLGAEKPLLASFMGGTTVEAGERVLNDAGIPTFRFPDRAAQAFNYLWRHSSALAGLYETPTLAEGSGREAPNRARVEELIATARSQHRVLLTEHESKQILAAYGIPVVETQVATSEEQAAAAATAMGFPVAIKLHSETITHKAAVGGVRLNVHDAEEVRAAFRAIRRSLTEKVGAHHFLGVSVERMAPAEGIEVIVGSSIDPQCGPVLLFGTGGRLVEALQDRALALPPLNSTLARRLMEQTRIHRALAGDANRPAVDLAAVERTLVRFSQLVIEHRWIREIEINPLLANAGGVVALDARVILNEASSEAQLPVPAIRAYPRQYVTETLLADGSPLVLRPIRPEDEPAMVAFHRTLSDHSVYLRYFGHRSLSQRIAHPQLARLCFIDYDREMALVAVHEVPGGRREIVGVARLWRIPGTTQAEFAVVVSDRWQRRGVGTRLLRRLVEVGRAEGIIRIAGNILTENTAMRGLCERVGFKLHRLAGEPECEAEIWP
jgi:acetyltransferase